MNTKQFEELLKGLGISGESTTYNSRANLFYEKQFLFLYLKLLEKGVLNTNDIVGIVTDAMKATGENLDQINLARAKLETYFKPVEEARRR